MRHRAGQAITNYPRQVNPNETLSNPAIHFPQLCRNMARNNREWTRRNAIRRCSAFLVRRFTGSWTTTGSLVPSVNECQASGLRIRRLQMTLTRIGQDFFVGSHQRCTQVARACNNDPVRWISVRGTRQPSTGDRDLRQHDRIFIVIKFWIDQPLRARFIRSVAEVELAQLRNRICKRESYRLEAVQYDCASTGSGNSLNRFTMGHRIGCSKRKPGSASRGRIHTLSQ
jgi:hypothetical protein